jgi:hypothetical protein
LHAKSAKKLEVAKSQVLSEALVESFETLDLSIAQNIYPLIVDGKPVAVVDDTSENRKLVIIDGTVWSFSNDGVVATVKRERFLEKVVVNDLEPRSQHSGDSAKNEEDTEQIETIVITGTNWTALPSYTPSGEGGAPANEPILTPYNRCMKACDTASSNRLAACKKFKSIPAFTTCVAISALAKASCTSDCVLNF